MVLKLKKGVSEIIINFKEVYKRKIESHFKQGNMKETWSGLKKSQGCSKPKSPLPSNLELNDLNQFHVRFGTINLRKEIADKRMELNVGKMWMNGLIVSENKTRKEFLNVNANKAKVSDGLTSILKNHVHHNCVYHIYSHIFNLPLSTSFQRLENFKNNPCSQKGEEKKTQQQTTKRPVTLTHICHEMLWKNNSEIFKLTNIPPLDPLNCFSSETQCRRCSHCLIKPHI